MCWEIIFYLRPKLYRNFIHGELVWFPRHYGQTKDWHLNSIGTTYFLALLSKGNLKSRKIQEVLMDSILFKTPTGTKVFKCNVDHEVFAFKCCHRRSRWHCIWKNKWQILVLEAQKFHLWRYTLHWRRTLERRKVQQNIKKSSLYICFV